MGFRLSCSLACDILGPQPGIKPAFPSFQRGFLITGHQGSSCPKEFLLRPYSCREKQGHKDAVWPPLLFDAELTPRSGGSKCMSWGSPLQAVPPDSRGRPEPVSIIHGPSRPLPHMHLLLVWGWEYWQLISLTMTSLPSRCCYSSIAKSCPTLCHPMNCSMQGFSVLHYLLEFA